MGFKEKYFITPDYITTNTKRRSGQLIYPMVKFVVAHDTGNAQSTAANNVNYFKRTANQQSASAHIFIDDKQILECVPALTGRPEKAWHVLYDLQSDNKMFGYNANDAAIGVEYCFGININADRAYDKYVWTIAYICFKFNLDPKKSVVGHHILNPGRKTDPENGLKVSGRNYTKLLEDIVMEYNDCLGNETSTNNTKNFVLQSGEAKTIAILRLREGQPNRKANCVRSIPTNTILQYIGWINNGEMVDGISKWYKDKDGNYFWSGAVK